VAWLKRLFPISGGNRELLCVCILRFAGESQLKTEQKTKTRSQSKWPDDFCVTLRFVVVVWSLFCFRVGSVKKTTNIV